MIDTAINKEGNEIQWPALLKFEGDNELIFLASQDMLFRELESLILDTNDLVIDSGGRCFQLESDSEKIGLNMTPKTYDLTEITDLIQAHEFSKAQVCIIKIQFDSIHAAIDSLRDQ